MLHFVVCSVKLCCTVLSNESVVIVCYEGFGDNRYTEHVITEFKCIAAS